MEKLDKELMLVGAVVLGITAFFAWIIKKNTDTLDEVVEDDYVWVLDKNAVLRRVIVTRYSYVENNKRVYNLYYEDRYGNEAEVEGYDNLWEAKDMMATILKGL